MTTGIELVARLRARVHGKDITRAEAAQLLCADWPGITQLGAEDLIDNGVQFETPETRRFR